jgi:hypothetical protein
VLSVDLVRAPFDGLRSICHADVLAMPRQVRGEYAPRPRALIRVGDVKSRNRIGGAIDIDRPAAGSG